MQAGESSVAAATRETEEELGLRVTPEQLRPLLRVTTGTLIQDVFLASVTFVPAAEVAFGPDTAEVGWVARGELERQIGRGEFFHYSYFGELP